jgi:hypothetical protein
MSSKHSWLAALAALMAAALASAALGGFQLLSGAEYQSELAARAAPGATYVTRGADFNAPTITVVKPDHSAPIQPPVDIDVEFKPTEGSTIDVGSLKVLYGFLKLDITQRILKAPGVQVSADGLKANGAQLPAGSHKLLIEIADNLGRVGRQTLEFTVKSSP